MLERAETFTVLINRISRNIKRIKNREMAEYGLKGHHVSCLYYLYSEGALTATELCERCEEDKATISRALDQLETMGYLLHQDAKVKRYKTPVKLSPTGMEMGKTVWEKVNFVLKEFCNGLSQEELQEFYRCLNIIHQSLEQCANRPEEPTIQRD